MVFYNKYVYFIYLQCWFYLFVEVFKYLFIIFLYLVSPENQTSIESSPVWTILKYCDINKDLVNNNNNKLKDFRIYLHFREKFFMYQ